MGVKCQILPTLPIEGRYRSGQILTGVVKYCVDKPTLIPYIVIFFKGKLKARNRLLENTKHWKHKEMLVFLHKIIHEDKNNCIQPGNYEYPFEFQLPKDLPSCVRIKTCKISYNISVEFMLPGLLNIIKKVKKEVHIYGDVKPPSEDPATAELTKNLFPTLKPIDLEVQVKKPFVTAGEYIKVNCLIDNGADIPVTGIRTKLIEVTTYRYGERRRKVGRKTVNWTSLDSRGAKERSEARITSVVPTLRRDVYTIQNSRYFSREYKVNVTAKFPFPHRNISVDIPVVIQASEQSAEMRMKMQDDCCFPFL